MFHSYLNENFLNLKGFNNGLVTGMMLIDLQKTFGNINHKILLEKLKAIGFGDDAVNWFHLYSTDQEFLVSTGDKYSSISKISRSWPFEFFDIRQ